MKKLILAGAVLLALAVQGAEASVFNVRSRVQADLAANKATYIYKKHRSPAKTADAASTVYYPLIVQFRENGGLDYLEQIGAHVFYTRRDMALCCVPVDSLHRLDNEQFVRRADISSKTSASLDRSRRFTGADAVHSGISPNVPGYDGSGVVTGFCDIGFDPGHIAFRDRIRAMVTYRDTLAIRSAWAPGSALDNGGALECDNIEESHATHVGNILAGGYRGNAYYGAAPGADIVATLSECSDMALFAGIEDVIAYAKEVGRPSVVNLSMSASLGPHDGTDLMNRYLDELGKETVIVFSAGNGGRGRGSLVHTFTAQSPTVTTCIEGSDWKGFNVSGAADIWSADSRPVDIRLVISDKQTHQNVWTSDWICPGGSDDASGSRIFTAADEGWNTYLPKAGNYAAVGWGTDDDNNRFNIYLEVHAAQETKAAGYNLARYAVGFEVRGAEGVSVDMFATSSVFFQGYVSGMTAGGNTFSINNMGCGDNTITVGSWNTRNTVPQLDAEDHVFSFSENEHTDFSSYGTLRDGRVLPHVCAPGNYVVSALSRPFINNGYRHPYYLGYQETVDGEKYYYGAECGTSMASPMAAGVFALWLQADPTLTVSEIRDIAMLTANRNFADIADPHWGASGALDAVAGLRTVIDRAGIDNVTNPLIISVNADRTLSVTLGSEPVPFAVHDLQGRPLPTSAPLHPGFYILTAAGYTRTLRL